MQTHASHSHTRFTLFARDPVTSFVRTGCGSPGNICPRRPIKWRNMQTMVKIQAFDAAIFASGYRFWVPARLGQGVSDTILDRGVFWFMDTAPRTSVAKFKVARIFCASRFATSDVLRTLWITASFAHLAIFIPAASATFSIDET